MYKGPHAHSHFLGKGGYFGRLSREESFPRKTGKRGVLLNQSPDGDYGGVFQKLHEKLRNRGMINLYVDVSRAFNSLPRKWDRALITSRICGRAPRG